MAAITPFLEDPEDVPPELEVPTRASATLGEPSPSDPTFLSRSSAVLHRFLWSRLLIEEELRKRRWWMEETAEGMAFRIDARLPEDLLPWRRMSPGARGDTFLLWSEGNRKMACPSWDLPAGAPFTGGSCLGATAGQPTVPPDKRRGQLVEEAGQLYLKARAPAPEGKGQRVAFDEQRPICAVCYATEGSYGYVEIQTAEILRYWWSRELVRTPEGREEWVEIMLDSLLAVPQKLSTPETPKATLYPVRVHSSGDFFNIDYARAWIALANAAAKRQPKMVFWAPTRTWAAASPDWNAAWPRLLAELRQPNFVIRPSAYHTGDSAPDSLVALGRPGAGRGTTAIFAADHRGEGDPRREWDCPVYALKKEGEKGSCEVAKCRVCWLSPEVRVNYTVH